MSLWVCPDGISKYFDYVTSANKNMPRCVYVCVARYKAISQKLRYQLKTALDCATFASNGKAATQSPCLQRGAHFTSCHKDASSIALTLCAAGRTVAGGGLKFMY